MKKILKRGLSLVLALTMMFGLLPVTAFAAVDSTGKPTDLNNTLVLSIYTGSGFPGEPAVYGTGNYKNINSSFAVKSGATFASSAANQLNWEKIKGDLVQGSSSGNTSVWGVYDANGTKDYFLSNASIIDRDNEIKMIQAIRNCTAEEAESYEIVWYVIKLQHNPGSGWFSRANTEWHIDGVIKEKAKISINYYGNGNTSGNAPLGITSHTAGDPYTVLGKNTMVKKINGVEVAFLGWSAKADGTGAEAGFYQPGDVINPKESISLYAMWDTTTQYTATVNTYLDNVLVDEDYIHGDTRDLYLSTDEVHYYQLTRSGEGVYTTKITGNGKFHLYNKSGNTYTQVGNRQLTIYNQNGSMDVYHYSLTYDTNGGNFETVPDKQVYYYGDTAVATAEVPTKDGYRFLGWMYNGKLIQPGEEATASVTGTMTLVAQWEKTVNVTINVTVNHEGGNGYDRMEDKDNVFVALVSRENATSPYLEVKDKTLTLDKGIVPTEQKVTTYTGYTFTDMPGGDVDYTVVTSKSGYDTVVTEKQDAEGNWIIDVVMTYNPSNFDLNFTVTVDNSVPERYIPDAAIVKVTFWSTDRDQWEIITQQEGGLPGIRVDFNGSRVGSGSYPVWKYESDDTTPYGYRLQITSFVYPDGTIVPASNVVTQDVAWTDNVYTATMSDVTGGATFGTQKGAYIGETDQVGTLNAVITMDLHNVTFDAQGGKVNGQASQTVTEQFKIPNFKNYIPTREGGYTFAGWYEDKACTVAATEGKDLTKDITLYAKWIEPLTISGTVSIAGSYKQNGVDVPVNDIDRALEAVVVLHELRDGHLYEVDSKTVTFNYDEDHNAAVDYSFTGIPNDGKSYQIHVLELNYGTGYDNESDADNTFTANEYTAVFGGDNVADVDAHLTFVPPSYDQPLKVDATRIGTGFRPGNVLAEVMYRDTGDNHPFKRISQHNVEPFGVKIALNNNGNGEGSQSIWKWHTDGMLYDYQMNISQVDGSAFNSDTAPFYITYAAPAYWNGNTNAPSGDLVATLIPKQYPITFDLAAEDDTVTGMESFKLSYQDEDGNTVVTDTYGVIHTWSFDTAITAVPQREGYTFLGWEADAEGVYDGSKIPAAVHQEVTLTAKWEKITYEVTTVADPAEGGTATGAGTYEYGSAVTIVAAPAEGYSFLGWYENDNLISNDLSYSFEIFENHNFTAAFSLNRHTLITEASPSAGGTTTGDGEYDYGTNVTVTATANTGYTFAGWYNGSKKISDDPNYSLTITENLTLAAKFELNQYRVETEANPAEGGTTSGDGTYFHGHLATVKAEPKTGYTFVGWYENGAEVSKDAEYRFEVTGDRKLTANFDQIVYQVTAKAERGGTAEGTATYHYGDTATVTATVDKTFTFDGWYEGTTKVSGDLEYTFTVTSDRELTAKFTKNGYNVTANHTDGGTTTGTGYYEEGERATVTAIPQQTHNFIGWFDENGVKESDSAEYSFIVTSDRTLTARFATAYTITTISSPENAGTLTGSGKYEAGKNAEITATAKAGYYFVGWYDENDELVTAETKYSLSVKENRTFTAKFERKKAYKCDYVYIFGYDDSEIGATGPLLRGELSQMIYRLVKQNNRGGTYNGGNSFSDTAGQWYESGISYMAEVGAIDRNMANAYPLTSVTRGETYKMICLGLGFTRDASLNYSDYAAILRNSGYLSDDGRVTAKIARWEFCRLFNAILGRSNYCKDGFIDTNGNEVTAETYGYTDLKPEDSYYRIMMIATSTFDGGKIDVVNRMKRNTYDFNK